MSVPAVLLLASSWLYLGFQWTIRIVVYPQLRVLAGAAFVTFEAAHQRLVSIAVGPLFAASAVTGVVAVIADANLETMVALACFAGILAITAFAAVPQHRRFAAGFDGTAYRRLLAADSVRLVLAGLAAAAALRLVLL